jgi:hypothetical protein
VPYTGGELVVYVGDKGEVFYLADKTETLNMANKSLTLESAGEVPFQIVETDYGADYIGTIENADYSAFTAVLYVWDKNGNRIINGESCTVALSGSDTTITYTVQQGDFDVTEGIYYGLFKLTRTSPPSVERTLKFTWEVFDRESPNTTSTSTSTTTTTTTSTSTSTTAPP